MTDPIIEYLKSTNIKPYSEEVAEGTLPGSYPSTTITRTRESRVRPIQQIGAYPSPSTSQPVDQDEVDKIASQIRVPGEIGGGLPEYQSNLKEIWNGFRQGTATLVDSLDAVTNLVSRATGWEKGRAFEKLRDYIQPTPEELADKNFGATLLRAIGAAGPIIAEFAVGTKGAGKLLSLARVPRAIKGVATAPIAAFGGIEGITAAGHGEPLGTVLAQTGKGMGMGLGMGIAGKFGPAIQTAGTGALFGGISALEGAETQDIMVQTLMGLGFGAHGAWKNAKGINMMRDYLANNGYEADVVAKMNPNKLRSTYESTLKDRMTNALIGWGMNSNEVNKLSLERLEKKYQEKFEENKVSIEEKKKSLTKEFVENNPEFLAKNRQTYIDFLKTKGFTPEVLEKVDYNDLRKIASSGYLDPTLWKIDPVSGEVKLSKSAVRKAKKKTASEQSTDELIKTITSTSDQAEKEKAQAALSQKEQEAIKKIQESTEKAAKDKEKGLKTDPITSQIDFAVEEALGEWEAEGMAGPPLIRGDQLKRLVDKYKIPMERLGDLQNALKDKGIIAVKTADLTMDDLTKAAEKIIAGKETIGAPEVIPDRILRAFEEKTRKILTREEWNAIKDRPDKDEFLRAIDQYYDLVDKAMAMETRLKEWKSKPSQKKHKGGRPPKFEYKGEVLPLTSETFDKIRTQSMVAAKAIKAWIGQRGIRRAGKLAAQETKVAPETEPGKLQEEIAALSKEVPKKSKTPKLKLPESLRKKLRDIGWDDEVINTFSNRKDITRLIKEKKGPDEVRVDALGNIVWETPKFEVDAARQKEIIPLLGNPDDVIKELGYTQEEIDLARSKGAPTSVGEGEKAPKEKGKAPKTAYKGLIKTIEDAATVYRAYLMESPKTERMETIRTVDPETKKVTISMEKVEAPSQETSLIRREKLKAELEGWLGKGKLTDEQLFKEMSKLVYEDKIEGAIEEYVNIPEKEKTIPTKVPETPKGKTKPKGLIKSLEQADTIFSAYKDEVNPEKKAMLKDALEQYLGKSNLSEEGLEAELDRRISDLSEPFFEDPEIKNALGLEVELEKQRNQLPPDLGTANPDEIVAKAYNKARELTPTEAVIENLKSVDSKVREINEQMAMIEYNLKDPALDPMLRQAYERDLVILRNDLQKPSAELDALRETYASIKESEGIPEVRYAGPRPGEVKVELADEGTGALLVSEGGYGVDRFYAIQAPDGTVAKADTTGNKIIVEIRVLKNSEKPDTVEVGMFNSSPGINPALEDALLSNVISKYSAFGKGKQKYVKVSHIPGVADDVWSRREDVETTLRKPTSKEDKDSNAIENIKDNRKVDGFANWIIARASRSFGGAKAWKESYSQRADLLESLSMLRSSTDPQQFDPDNFRAEVFPEHQRMLGPIELLGDPTLSKIPIIRWATQKGAQGELQVQYLTNYYIDKVLKTFGSVFGDSPERQKAFWQHVHKVRTSTDPIILEAVRKYRGYKEDMARVLGAKEKGWYLDEYGTIRYDMNKIWDILKEPFIKADSYGELNDSLKASLNNDSFYTAKRLAKTHRTWDEMPKADRDWLQQNVFNFNGVWSEWAYLPEFIQRSLPRKFFTANMQARTAGDAYKAALDYDFFDIEKGYILSVVRGAIMNDILAQIRPIVNKLPNASQFGSVRNYLERYMKNLAGQKPNLLDPFWNSFATRVNETLDVNLVPLYVPSTVAKVYIPMLYRGVLGVDTALRNLTQTIYTMANNGPSATLKGVLEYVDARRKKTSEYKKFEMMISLPDEFLEIGRPIRPIKEARNFWDKVAYVNDKITKAALYPMKLSEHVNKGIAYFAGLEEAARKGYDMNTAHIVGTAKASLLDPIPALELTEGQYKAFRSMGETQFLYTSAHTSPYLQSSGIKMFTPFWSFPIKTAQLLWNNALLKSPKGEKTGVTPEHVLSKPDYAWIRFLALTGFMATAPTITSRLFGIDTQNMWGKGVFPQTIYPTWMEAIGKIYQSIGGKPGDFLDRERAQDFILRYIGSITLPQYRWISKIRRDVMNAQRGYRLYGREQRPLVEVSWLDEVADIFGFPPSKLRDAQDLMKEYKDEKFKNMVYKHDYLYRSVDAMQEGDFLKARNILAEAKTKHNIDITPLEVQHAIAKTKEDIWASTMKGAPKAIRQNIGFQQQMAGAQQKFMPSMAKSYGTKPMWSSLSEAIEETKESPFNVED